MSFNVSGMMKGIGAGLVNYGEILKEQDKQDWDEQQALLKYEREERMNKLKIAADKENTQYQVNATKETAANALAEEKIQNANLKNYQEGQLQVGNRNAKTQEDEAASQAALRDAQGNLLDKQALSTETNTRLAEEAANAQTEAKKREILLRDQKLEAIRISSKPDSEKEDLYLQTILGPDVKIAQKKGVSDEEYNKAFVAGQTAYTALDKDQKKQVESQADLVGLPPDLFYAKTYAKGFVDSYNQATGTGALKGPTSGSTGSTDSTGNPVPDDLIKINKVVADGSVTDKQQAAYILEEKLKNKTYGGDMRGDLEVALLRLQGKTPTEIAKMKTEQAKKVEGAAKANKGGGPVASTTTPAANEYPKPIADPSGVAVTGVLGGQEPTRKVVPTVVSAPEDQRALAMSKLRINGPYKSLSAAKKSEVDAEVAKMNRGK